ncbi:MAG TPA: hypothetical protein VL986_08125 [Terracidiphilus sp.]|nr:hypothetical protein [Terracidiphilus sp.]
MSRTFELQSNHSPRGGKVFGFPLEGFSLFQSLLLAVASAFFTFFLTTCIAIFAFLGWRLFGHPAVNFTYTYRYIGFPAGVLVLVVGLPFFLALWARAKVRR